MFPVLFQPASSQAYEYFGAPARSQLC